MTETLTDITKVLAELDINAKDDSGETRLHFVARCNRSSEIKDLLSLGADVNVRDDCDWTPLHFAAKCTVNDSHLETARVLLEAGADASALNNDKSTPLHLLVEGKDHTNVKTIELFAKFRADFNAKDGDSDTPLINAVRQGSLEVVRLLVEYGSDVNCVNPSNGETPLHIACYAKNLEMIKCLLKSGADVNALDFDCCTPLMNVFTWGRDTVEFKNTVEFFLKYGEVHKIDCEKRLILYVDSANMWRIIAAHLAKLQVLEISVHPSFSKMISMRTRIGNYFEKCKDELLLAKSTKLRSSWITFFDFLMGSRRKLKNYAGNEELMRDFWDSECDRKFTIYGREMWKNVEKGIKRRELFDESSIVLSDYLPIFNPNHLIIRDILDCVDVKKFLN